MKNSEHLKTACYLEEFAEVKQNTLFYIVSDDDLE